MQHSLLYQLKILQQELGTTRNVEINNKFDNPFIFGGPKRYYSLFEIVPYMKRTCFICLPTTFERNATKDFEEYKQRFEGCTMPPIYQESVRLTKILNNIIDALQRKRKKMSPESECSIWQHLWLRLTRRLPPSMSHLDGLNWEVVVVFFTLYIWPMFSQWEYRFKLGFDYAFFK